MNKLKVKNIGLTGFIILFGAVLSACSVFISIPPVKLPFYLVLSAAFVFLLIINLITYTRASFIQSLKISFSGFILLALISIAGGFSSNLIKTDSITLTDNILKISPIYLALSIFFSILATINLLKLESIKLKKPIESAPSNLDILNNLKSEPLTINNSIETITKEESKQTKEPEIKQNQPSKKEEVLFLEDFEEKEPEIVFEIEETEEISDNIEINNTLIKEIEESENIESIVENEILQTQINESIEITNSFLVEDVKYSGIIENTITENSINNQESGYISRNNHIDEFLSLNDNKIDDEPKIIFEEAFYDKFSEEKKEEKSEFIEDISENTPELIEAQTQKQEITETTKEEENKEFLKEKLEEPRTQELINRQTEVQELEELMTQELINQQTGGTSVQEFIEEQVQSDEIIDKLTEDISQVNEIKGKNNATESLVNEDNKYEFIPESLRLNEPVLREQPESRGKISSIGKLLINQRDIENIIETNALMQHVTVSNGKTNIINTISGENLKQKLIEIKSLSKEIKDVIFIDAGGFVISSVTENKINPDTLGAISSGIFQSVINYLSQLSTDNPVKMFFETANSINSIFKIEDKFLFINSNKEFEPVDHTVLSNFFTQSIISIQDLSVIKNINGVSEAIITNKEGSLLGSIKSSSPEKTALIASAIFENMKVFLLGIKNDMLDRITIFTDKKVIIVKKYDDKTAAFIFTTEGPIQYSKQVSMIDEIIK